MTAPGNGLGSLRRLAAPRPAPAPGPASAPASGPAPERCEMCAAGLGERHGHLADVHDHRLLCVCRPCALLFAPQGAGAGRYRMVGEDVRVVADLDLQDAHWDSLRVPVDLVFFLSQSGADRVVAFYPGPGGATESELTLDAWADLTAANPVLASAEPDVEAVLLRRHPGAPAGFSCYVVPVDLCYELVGTVRLTWTGLGGGPEVWNRIDGFFAGLAERARPVTRTGAS